MEKLQLIVAMWVVLGAFGATFHGMFAYLETYNKKSFLERFALSLGAYVAHLAMGPVATIKIFCITK